MRLGRLLVVCCASLALLAPSAWANPWAGVQAWETATVLRIVDGDTIIVRDDATGQRERIRLLGINAPEIDTAIKGGQCGGWQAKAAVETWIQPGSSVRLLSADPNSRGVNNRPQRVVLAYNPASGDYDLDIAWGLAEQGWAIWYTVAREAAMSSLYREVIAGAQQRRVGIWNPNLCGELEQPEAQVEMRIGRTLPGQGVRDEYVVVRNVGPVDVDLTDWLLRDSGNQGWFRFPGGSILTPGEYRVVHTGRGVDGSPQPRDLYAQHTARLYPQPGRGPVLLGDGAYLLDRYGNYRFWREYPCTVDCEALPHAGAIVMQDMSLGKKRGKKRARTQWMRFQNVSEAPVCLDGYRVTTGATTYRIKPGTCVDPGATWTLNVRRGMDQPGVAFMNRTNPVLWKSGSVQVVTDREQVIVNRSW